MLIPVILAGGFGSRLWPLSRQAHPKQFIPLLNSYSLFQNTLQRIMKIPNIGKPIILGNEQHRFLIAEQIRQSGIECTIILEPSFKGTAPAIALAAIEALRLYDETVQLLILPADHQLENTENFVIAVNNALPYALHNHLITFGIIPTHAHTGFGYIQKGLSIGENNGFEVSQFIEKPALAMAKQYVQSEAYLWNSGMFLFTAKTFIQELQLHAPKIYAASIHALQKGRHCSDFIRPCPQEFDKAPVDSIDYAIMERTQKAVVIPLHCPWNDIGSWEALATALPQDLAGNNVKGDVLLEKTENTLVQSHHRLVVGVGLKNLIIVETSDAVLVLEKSHSQDLKNISYILNKTQRKETLFPTKVNRPWGAFESIDEGERFHVKHIRVDVGQRLSLQRHHHRSEHWVVVKGTAQVTRGSEVYLLSENQSTYIPIGVNHSLENVGKIPLEIIEVQSGAYLGEDDIIRLEDKYGRTDLLPEKILETVE